MMLQSNIPEVPNVSEIPNVSELKSKVPEKVYFGTNILFPPDILNSRQRSFIEGRGQVRFGHDFIRTDENTYPGVSSMESFYSDYPSNVKFLNKRVLASCCTLNTVDKARESTGQTSKCDSDGSVFPGKIDQNIIQELEKEIVEICTTLGISSDPLKWSSEGCRKWVLWHIGKIHASQLYRGDFKIAGEDLCKLTVNEFRYLFHPFGDTLHAQLDVWKRAKELSFDTNKQKLITGKGSNGKYSQGNWSVSIADNTRVKESTEQFSSGMLCEGNRRNSKRQTIHLWEFLKELLKQPSMYSSCITWLDQDKGIFKIENSTRVAMLWGRRKNRPAMNFDKLSRSIRQYYKKNIIKKTENSKRLVYQFCQRVL